MLMNLILTSLLLIPYPSSLLDNSKNIEKEVTCLTENIYFEARDQSIIGQIAVGQVTLNRYMSKRYPNTICKVVKQKLQFSWYWDGKSDIMKETRAKEQSYKVAIGVLSGKYLDPTKGALYYHNFTVSPYWIKNLKLTTIIDSHLFYK